MGAAFIVFGCVTFALSESSRPGHEICPSLHWNIDDLSVEVVVVTCNVTVNTVTPNPRLTCSSASAKNM